MFFPYQRFKKKKLSSSLSDIEQNHAVPAVLSLTRSGLKISIHPDYRPQQLYYNGIIFHDIILSISRFLNPEAAKIPYQVNIEQPTATIEINAQRYWTQAEIVNLYKNIAKKLLIENYISPENEAQMNEDLRVPSTSFYEETFALIRKCFGCA